MRLPQHLLWPSLCPGYRAVSVELAALAVTQSIIIIALALSWKLLIIQAQPGSQTGTVWPLAGLAAAVLITALLRIRQRYASELLAVRYVHNLRVAMLTHLIGEADDPAGSHSVHTVRFASDLTAIRQWVVFSTGRMISAWLLCTAIVIAVWLLAPFLGQVTLGILLLGVMSYTLVGRRLERVISQQRRHRGRLTHRIGHLLQHRELISRSGRSAFEQRRIEDASNDLSASQLQRGFWSGVLWACSDVIARSVMVGVIVFAILFPQHLLEQSTLLLIVLLLSLLQAPTREIARTLELWTGAQIAADRIRPLLKIQTSTNLIKTHLSPPQQLQLLYGVLPQGIRLPAAVIPVGTKIVLTGDNDSCLQTVLRALSGCAGHGELVRIDRVPVCHLDPEVRSKLIGTAFTDDALVAGSMSKNLRYRARTAKPKALRAALQSVGLDPQKFDDGLASRIQPGQVRASGDFATRLRWARAILQQPAVVLLEWTDKSLDAQGEEAFRRFLTTYPGSIIFVSNNTSHAELADQQWHVSSRALTIDPSRKAA